VLLVAKDVFQFAEIFHYNATTCQDKRKNQQFEVPYCHKRNDHLLNDYLIYLILFANDTVLFGKTPEILQHLLDKLFIYCRKWNIEVNTDKTKVAVFRNSWWLLVAKDIFQFAEIFHYNATTCQDKRKNQQF
jgi:hypothetical protein